MTLITQELNGSGLQQELTPDKDLILAAIRPHIVRYGRPSGSLQIQVLDASDTLIAESEVIDIADIGSADYFHGYVRFNTSCGLEKNTLYKFKLVGVSGYSFSESAYIGVANDFDLRKYPASYANAEGMQAPLDIEIWNLSSR